MGALQVTREEEPRVGKRMSAECGWEDVFTVGAAGAGVVGRMSWI